MKFLHWPLMSGLLHLVVHNGLLLCGFNELITELIIFSYFKIVLNKTSKCSDIMTCDSVKHVQPVGLSVSRFAPFTDLIDFAPQLV